MRGYIIEPVDIPALRWLIFLARNTQKLLLWQVHCLGYWMSAMGVEGGGVGGEKSSKGLCSIWGKKLEF